MKEWLSYDCKPRDGQELFGAPLVVYCSIARLMEFKNGTIDFSVYMAEAEFKRIDSHHFARTDPATDPCPETEVYEFWKDSDVWNFQRTVIVSPKAIRCNGEREGTIAFTRDDATTWQDRIRQKSRH